jgi:hypothetical protein
LFYVVALVSAFLLPSVPVLGKFEASYPEFPTRGGGSALSPAMWLYVSILYSFAIALVAFVVSRKRRPTSPSI